MGLLQAFDSFSEIRHRIENDDSKRGGWNDADYRGIDNDSYRLDRQREYRSNEFCLLRGIPLLECGKDGGRESGRA